jgi:hypothetical protein
MPTKGAILLGEVARHLASVEVACNFCERRGKASITRLMKEHGPDMPVPSVLRVLSVRGAWLNGSLSHAGCTCRAWRTCSGRKEWGAIMIVTTRPRRRKRPAKPTQPQPEITAPRIVQHAPKWEREPKPLAPDPEGEARVAAFFARMGIKVPEGK